MERHTGMYRGLVLARSQNRQGCLKIYVPGVHPEICAKDPNSLPDAEQAGPLFCGVSNGSGMFSYPHIGSLVWVFFQNGDQNYPVYFAAVLGGQQNGGQFASVEPLQDNPQGAYVHKIVAGTSTILLSEMGDITIETRHTNDNGEPRDSTIRINQDGVIDIHSSNTIKMDTDVFEINAKTKMTIETPRFKVKTDYDPKEAHNGITLQAESISMDTGGKGDIYTTTKTNGARCL